MYKLHEKVCKVKRNALKKCSHEGGLFRSVPFRSYSVPFHSVPFYDSLFRAVHFSEGNGTFLLDLVLGPAKILFLSGTVLYRSFPFRTVLFSCEWGLSNQ